MVGRIVGVLGPEGRMWVSVGFAVSQPMGAIPSVQGAFTCSFGSLFAKNVE
ncbi:hypothetical protein HMPREF9475_02730 [[Clostridium] symbiosum WAL-14673]|uniref:Uncharacterized protein n=1 Tax=Enterocloster bolteae (strain ATCC BAA-613 / DSM 15670 / CCUG 46953 / JCM 12243 / WAL 16351) TaxID=411902 RepID=A8RQ86_ENTBW|nr:hypothetical protein CLOBOL_02673 [Enterocloster bolteae ATCC BAA-613]EGB18145.1 hypothetical protein HMPREF9475_02730 [[Clostridium] symbiosum WAL-14673]